MFSSGWWGRRSGESRCKLDDSTLDIFFAFVFFSIYFVLYVVGVREDKEVERKAGKSAVEQSCRLRLSQLSSSKKVLGSADCWWNKSLTFTKSTQTPPVCQLRSSAKGHKWEKGGTRRIIWGISGTKKDFSRLKATRGAGGENSLQLQWDRDPGAWHNNKIQDDLDMCVETNLFVHSTVIQSVPVNVTEKNPVVFRGVEKDCLGLRWSEAEFSKRLSFLQITISTRAAYKEENSS